MARRALRMALRIGATLGAATLVIGLLHMPFARPLLGRLGMHCPARASAKEVESARMASAKAARGVLPSPARPALGFRLDAMTLGDVEGWAAKSGVQCERSRQDSLLKCADVPAVALGQTGAPFEDVSFSFSPDSAKLVNLTTLRAGLTPEDAAREMTAIVERLHGELGQPRLIAGEPSAAYLAGGSLRTALVEYRYRDYIADVSTTNVPGRGVLLREHYMSAAD